MTTQELILLLGQYPPDTRIVVTGYEGGYNDITTTKTVLLQINAHTDWWMGQHGATENKSAEPALCLAGENQLAKDA